MLARLASNVLLQLWQFWKGQNPLDDFWSKEFPITSVTRADIVAAGIPRTAVEKLSDDDMRQIASEMEDIYSDHG